MTTFNGLFPAFGSGAGLGSWPRATVPVKLIERKATAHTRRLRDMVSSFAKAPATDAGALLYISGGPEVPPAIQRTRRDHVRRSRGFRARNSGPAIVAP